MNVKSILFLTAALLCLSLPVSQAAENREAAKTSLIEIISDRPVTDPVVTSIRQAAERYVAFWDTSKPEYAEKALAKNFTDRTLPEGRAQGTKGPLDASSFVRKAIPDLRVAATKMIISGDYVVVHLNFSGHFTGIWKDTKGQGQEVSFVGTDIYHVEGGKIIENWHVEDNLSFIKQMGVN